MRIGRARVASLMRMVVVLVFVLWAALELFVAIKVADAIGVIVLGEGKPGQGGRDPFKGRYL